MRNKLSVLTMRLYRYKDKIPKIPKIKIPNISGNMDVCVLNAVHNCDDRRDDRKYGSSRWIAL